MQEQKFSWDIYQVHSIFGEEALGDFHGPCIGDIAVLTINKKARFDIQIDAIDGDNFSGTVLAVSQGITSVHEFDGLHRGQKVNFIHQNVCTIERRIAGNNTNRSDD